MFTLETSVYFYFFFSFFIPASLKYTHQVFNNMDTMAICQPFFNSMFGHSVYFIQPQRIFHWQHRCTLISKSFCSRQACFFVVWTKTCQNHHFRFLLIIAAVLIIELVWFCLNSLIQMNVFLARMNDCMYSCTMEAIVVSYVFAIQL